MPARLVVDAADAPRARKILDLPDFTVEQDTPRHPCPSCGAADPEWLGKWKAFVLIASIVAVSLAFFLRPRWVLPVLVVAAIAFAGTVYLLPEFRCRRCGHVWRA